MSAGIDLQIGENKAKLELDRIVADLMNTPGIIVPAYTHNANCTELILDHIAALGWAITVFTSGWGGKTLIRCCIARSPAAAEHSVGVIADTRPLAICRAFIQAMERWGDEGEWR